MASVDVLIAECTSKSKEKVPQSNAQHTQQKLSALMISWICFLFSVYFSLKPVVSLLLPQEDQRVPHFHSTIGALSNTLTCICYLAS